MPVAYHWNLSLEFKTIFLLFSIALYSSTAVNNTHVANHLQDFQNTVGKSSRYENEGVCLDALMATCDALNTEAYSSCSWLISLNLSDHTHTCAHTHTHHSSSYRPQGRKLILPLYLILQERGWGWGVLSFILQKQETIDLQQWQKGTKQLDSVGWV